MIINSERVKIMILTTTPTIEGHEIEQYCGVVFGEVVSGVDFLRDMAAGITNFFGGRSGSYEEELIHARESAMREMENRAYSLGANAVVGIDIDYEVLGSNNGMLMVTASGTAGRDRGRFAVGHRTVRCPALSCPCPTQKPSSN